jgi:hypothetical protein
MAVGLIRILALPQGWLKVPQRTGHECALRRAFQALLGTENPGIEVTDQQRCEICARLPV